MKVADLQLRQLTPIQPLRPGQKPESTVGPPTTRKTAFADVLKTTLRENRELRFSAHALKRLGNRGIELNSTAINRLEEGVKKMESKGARNSLILMDDNAFIINVKNRVVVTALEKNSTQGNVFTNIDGVAIM
ncbi:MAG: hypothetical protein GXO90_04430 [FCB group bacterium]|nr:hypothetical protein [FCB group bacterium]